MLAGVATSQTVPGSTLNAYQENNADQSAETTLNVVTVEDGVRGAATASGLVVGINAGGDSTITTDQTNRGEINAHTVVNAVDPDGGMASMGQSSQVDTTAIGNSGSTRAYYGTMSGIMVQTNTGAVTARGQVEGETAQAPNLAIDTRAAGNLQAVELVNGSTGSRISQRNEGDVAADGGAVVQYVEGTSSVKGVATGNAIDLAGYDQSAARVVTDQYNISDKVQATKFTAYGNSYLTSTSTTAAGNSLNAVNDGTLLDVTSQQYNSAYVRSQAQASSYDFGGAQATAYGVGNTALVSNSNGPGLVLDNSQVNDGGGVEVIASFEGNGGYDAGASATAVGNSVSGYLCSRCGGSMTTTNSQSNNTDVSARSTVNVASGARSVTGVSSATGNSAVFSVGN